MTRNVPIALTIAGSDSSGGAGIQADIKTFSALGVYGASVVTSLTAQNTCGVAGVLPVPPSFTRAQIDAVAGDLRIAAVKTGMLGDRETVLAVVGGIRAHGLRPLVVDPVMVATSGDALLVPDAITTIIGDLLPLADIVTPNLPEAARLLGVPQARSEAEMVTQARAILEFGARAVFIKGGHGDGEEAVDILVRGATVTRLARPRVATRNSHGTGCTLSAAIAAGLAAGRPLDEAVVVAKDFVWRALEAGRDMAIGAGHGPVDHLHGSTRC